MEFQSTSAPVLIGIMAFGLIFSLAGIWMMLRPAKEGDAARIELFGMKFQSSSAGLLVFLVGAAFAVSPFFVPERDVAGKIARAAPQAPGDQETVTARAATGVAAHDNPTKAAAAVILPAGAEVEEVEPNNGATEAKQIARAVFVAGRIDPSRQDPVDWFVFPLAGFEDTDISVQVRSVEGHASAYCEVELMDAQEQRIANRGLAAPGNATVLKALVPAGEYVFLRIRNNYDDPCTYELKVL